MRTAKSRCELGSRKAWNTKNHWHKYSRYMAVNIKLKKIRKLVKELSWVENES